MDLGSPFSSTRRVAAANAVRKRPAWNAAYGTLGSGTGISPAVAGRSVGSPNTVAGGGRPAGGGLGATLVGASAGAAGAALAAGAFAPGRLAIGFFAAGRVAAAGGAAGFFSRTTGFGLDFGLTALGEIWTGGPILIGACATAKGAPSNASPTAHAISGARAIETRPPLRAH